MAKVSTTPDRPHGQPVEATAEPERGRRSDVDRLLQEIAEYTLAGQIDSAEAWETARYCLLDAVGCGLLALGYPACSKLIGPVVPEATLPGEVIVKGKHDFYSYESKYLDPNGSETRIPAALPRPLAKKISTMAARAFKALSLRGMARVDFLASRDLRTIYVNEVNTIPGFTSISMYPKLWEASGLPLTKLIDRLIELALEEHRDRATLKTTYRAERREPGK